MNDMIVFCICKRTVILEMDFKVHLDISTNFYGNLLIVGQKSRRYNVCFKVLYLIAFYSIMYFVCRKGGGRAGWGLCCF